MSGSWTLDVVLEPAALAFLEVGTFVAAMLAVFGLIQWRTGGGVSRWLERHHHLGPLAGAVLGVVPGCGGALILMPLYLRGTVSFGTVVAALVATMGDSSFVLMATAPGTAVLVHLLLMACGLLTGLIVDRLGIVPRRPASAAPAEIAQFELSPRTSTVGAAAVVFGLSGRPMTSFPPPSLIAFWAVAGLGLVVAVPVVFHLVEPERLDVGGLPLFLLTGLAGVAACLAIVVRNRGRHRPCGAPTSAPEALLDGARETAVVVLWVAAAFVAYEALVALAGLDLAHLATLGLLGVVAGAAVGLIPGCGPQLVLTGLYAQGALPLSTLVANALSQDGDALFALLAVDRRAAILATTLSVIPGVLVGGTLALLGY